MASTLIFLGLLAGVTLVGVGSSWYLGDDNQVEEMAESYIENKTGVDLDLSPTSPEKKK